MYRTRQARWWLALCCCAQLLSYASGARAEAELSPEEMLQRAELERYHSPARARELGAALRERVRLETHPLIIAQSHLNDCQSLIEDDNTLAAAAAQAGLALLGVNDAAAEPTRIRLEVCDALAHEYLGDMSASLARYGGQLERAQALADPVLEADVRMARGELLGYLGRYAESLEDLQHACAVYEQRELEDQALYCLQAIGIVQFRLGDYPGAIEVLNGVSAQREARDQPYMLADAKFNLARALDGAGRDEEALASYAQGRALYVALENNTGAAYVDQATGALLGRRGEHAGALAALDPALNAFRNLGDTDMTARLQQLRATSLVALGQLKAAEAAIEEAQRLYLEIDNQVGLERVYRASAQLRISERRFTEAAQMLLLARELHEELDRARRDEELAHQRAQFDTEQKEQENLHLRQQRALADEALANADSVDQLKTAVLGLAVVLLLLAIVFVARQYRLARKLRVLALVDELTGMANRRGLLAYLHDQAAQHRVSKQPLSLVLIDIDHFKLLNDAHGHAAGDEALRAVSNVCQHTLRGNDRIGRTGGEEFLAVLPRATLAHGAEIAERLCTQLRKTSLAHIAPGVKITVSIGVSELHPSETGVMDAIKRADAALYRAKDDGRDCVRLGAT